MSLFKPVSDCGWLGIILWTLVSLVVLVLFAVVFSGIPEDEQRRINEIMRTRAVGGVPVVIVK